MKKSVIFVLILVFSCTAVADIIHTEADNYLAQKVPSFIVQNSTLYNAIVKLCREEKVRICLEEEKNFSLHTSNHLPSKKFSAVYLNTTIYDILTDFCKKNPDYFWEYSRDGLLNVIPRSTTLGTYDNSTLEWWMPGFMVITTSVSYICSTAFPYGAALYDHGIGIDWISSTTLSNIYKHKATINLPPATGRDGLNSIVKSAGPGYIWHLIWKNRKPVIKFQKIFP